MKPNENSTFFVGGLFGLPLYRRNCAICRRGSHNHTRAHRLRNGEIMLTENQQAWVDALRSGEFTQAKGTLQSDEGYCCLGVLCKVAERHGVFVAKDFSGKLYGDNLGQQSPVQDWVGIPRTSVNGLLKGTEDHPYLLALTELNDRGMPFSQIADIIEQNAESLFERTENV